MSTKDNTTVVVELTDAERMIQDVLDHDVISLIASGDEAIDPEEANVSDDERRQRWLQRRPNIDHLKPGTVTTVLDGVSTTLPLFDVGERIVIDVSTTFLNGNPWLQTIVGKVRSIDDDTGVVTVWDEDTDGRNPMVRYVSMKDQLTIFKLAPQRGNVFDATHVVRVPKAPLMPGEVKKGRGRPVGSKNRPKEVIKAEREAYKAMRAEKKVRR